MTTSQHDGYTIGYPSDYFYFGETSEMIVNDLSKQQLFDAAPKEIQGISAISNSNSTGYDIF